MNIICEFNLNNHEKIAIKSADSLEDIHFCDDIEIYFISDCEYRLVLDCFQYTVRSFIDHLNGVIENKLALHPSVKADLGYLLEEKYSGVSKLDFVKEKMSDGSSEWIGYRYLLFSTPGDFGQCLATWLYNNDAGEIVIEITPGYKWHFQDPEPGEDYITYQEFIKSYQPLLFRTIDQEVAKKWVIKAQELLSQVEARDL
jgi:hypothetical protein